jgi:uncharacterized cupin superfamily protein
MPNVNDPHFDEPRTGRGFEARRARLGRQAGSDKLGLSLWELDPGITAYPYHWHVVEEELIVVLDGRPNLRTPEGWRRLEPGEVVAFLVGEQGTHQLVNDTDELVRFLSISNWASGPEICFYVDSDKVGVYQGIEGRELFKRDTKVDYWLDEEPPTPAGSSSA